MNGNTGLVGFIDRCQRGSPIDRGQPTCVAMSQNIHNPDLALGYPCVANPPQPVIADTLANGDILVAQRGRGKTCFGRTPVGRQRG